MQNDNTEWATSYSSCHIVARWQWNSMPWLTCIMPILTCTCYFLIRCIWHPFSSVCLPDLYLTGLYRCPLLRSAGGGDPSFWGSCATKYEQCDYELQCECQPSNSSGQRQRALLWVHTEGWSQHRQGAWRAGWWDAQEGTVLFHSLSIYTHITSRLDGPRPRW